MKRWHGYAVLAVVVLGIGSLVAVVVWQLALTPQQIAPFCGALFLVAAVLIWEVAMKPWGLRKQAWENLRGRKPSPPRARKVPRAAPPVEAVLDAGREGPRVPADLGEDE